MCTKKHTSKKPKRTQRKTLVVLPPPEPRAPCIVTITIATPWTWVSTVVGNASGKAGAKVINIEIKTRP